MARDYSLTPLEVPRVETQFRRIVTPLPAPDSLPILEKLRRFEPVAMQGQPPIVWNRAEGFQVYDRFGNCWIDWSSGVLITNSGHANKEVIDAIVAQAQSQLLTTYCFPSEIRAQLVEKLASVLPEPLKKIFLLTTGSETVECAIKLCRSYGLKAGGRSKHVIVSYDKAFHGRTLGSQQAGGIPALKEWIVNLDKGFVQVPFPDGYRTEDTSFDFFQKCLREQNIDAANVAGVVMETYQGGSAAFAPPEYVQALRKWCDGHKILLVFDEVQAGFGRTGTLWGFEHYGVVPDLATFGKGISSSLPLAAVAGRPDVLDLYPPGTMSSTHSGNPVCSAASLASIDVVLKQNLAANSCRMGEILHSRLHALQQRLPNRLGRVDGKGLVAGVACVLPKSKEPDGDLAWNIVERCYGRGLLMFSPVGYGGATVKICPPLVINKEALEESLDVFEQVVEEVAH